MSYSHLSKAERKVVYFMREIRECSLRAIAEALGRSVSTISRELRRNLDGRGEYHPDLACVLYWKRRERLVVRPKSEHAQLMHLVVKWLKEDWSPEQIAGRFRYVQFVNDPEYWISHETIYRYVKADRRRGGKLYRLLRRSGLRKYQRKGHGGMLGRMMNRTSIDMRPIEVNMQARFGDWEGDTIRGGDRQGHAATFVERKSLFLAGALMRDAKADTLRLAARTAFDGIPNGLIHTITVDNGKEFAAFEDIEKDFDTSVYFAHPYSAWERGVNENTNGLLRQYILKKTNLLTLSPTKFKEAIDRLNNRPRKKLKYRTPQEVFTDVYVALGS
jgi:IS30 family transposase